MSTLWLTRATLRRDPSLAALARVLVPDDANDRASVSHRLVWSLFADGPDRTRDFLWREEKPGQVMLLSARPPCDPHHLFEMRDPKPFEPALAVGDMLQFSLRANPVVARSKGPGQRGRRHDVVMDALSGVARGARAEARPGLVIEAGRAWLNRQAERAGFEMVCEAAVDGYDRISLPRPGDQPPAVFGVLDFDGVLRVTDPARFVTALGQGFGRAKAFGCGLMLVRRARLS